MHLSCENLEWKHHHPTLLVFPAHAGFGNFSAVLFLQVLVFNVKSHLFFTGCPANCLDCDGTATSICAVCKDGYTLKSDLSGCDACTDTNCKDCDVTGFGTCDKCKDGYFLDSGACVGTWQNGRV